MLNKMKLEGRSGGSATTTGVRPAGRESALVAAERFLAETAEAVTPDTPAPALLSYAARYRSHLAALVAASRRPDSR